MAVFIKTSPYIMVNEKSFSLLKNFIIMMDIML